MGADRNIDGLGRWLVPSAVHALDQRTKPLCIRAAMVACGSSGLFLSGKRRSNTLLYTFVKLVGLGESAYGGPMFALEIALIAEITVKAPPHIVNAGQNSPE